MGVKSTIVQLIVNATTAGKSLLTAANAAAQKTLLSLQNVDNTSDANKPVSTAQQTALDLKANLASPALTGTPTTPTAAGGTNTTQIASTAFVTSAVASAVTGLLEFQGNVDCSANPNYPAGSEGDTYYVSVAGKIGGASGVTVAVGDAIVCKSDNAGGTEASVGTSWFVLEKNLAGAILSANNLSDLADAATARTNLGLGTLATQSGTFSGTSSGTNTGDQNLFSTIAVSGQSSVSADASGDTLTLIAGTNVTITTNASTDEITITAAGGSTSPGGSTKQVQFNSSGSFGGAAGIEYQSGASPNVTVIAQAASHVPLLVKGASSQSAALQEWQTSAGTVIASITAAGRVQATYNQGFHFLFSGSSLASIIADSGAIQVTYGGAACGSFLVGYSLPSDKQIRWANATGNPTAFSAYDAGFSRNAAGVVEVNNGTAGTFRDLIVRNLRMSAPTLVPASASAAGSEGQVAWDASYIYVCTATNTWKRVAIATW